MREIIAKITASVLLLLFWLTAGVFLSPFWLLIVIIGALLDVFSWREAPKIFADLVMIRWFLES